MLILLSSVTLKKVRNLCIYKSVDEEPEKRLHVEIKPLTNGTAPLSASVDELRSTIENLTLSSAGLSVIKCVYNNCKLLIIFSIVYFTQSRKLIIDPDAQMKRSQSVSQQIGSSSPPPRHPYAPLSSPMALPSETSPNPAANPSDPTARYAGLCSVILCNNYKIFS